jgi:hypothetical protein
MAGYTITHRCGHTQEHQLFGPGKERDRKIEWLAGTVCSECYRGERKAAGPMFLARLIPGFSPAAAVASVAAHKTRAADLRARAEREIGGANRIHTCGGRDDCARSYLRQASEEDRQAAYDERDAKKPARPDSWEVACYENSYDIREQLKGRRWKFSDSAPRPATGDLIKDAMYGTGKGWIFAGPIERIVPELEWIKAQGWQIAIEDRLLTLLRSPLEGRPDLAGLPN